jgi:hypothetical protein
MIPDAWQILNTPTSYEHNGMLLEVMAHARNI